MRLQRVGLQDAYDSLRPTTDDYIARSKERMSLYMIGYRYGQDEMTEVVIKHGMPVRVARS